jgi:hypothetical protein
MRPDMTAIQNGMSRAEEKLLHPRPGGRIEAARAHGVDLTLLIERLRRRKNECAICNGSSMTLRCCEVERASHTRPKMQNPMPNLHIIGGANGAGKTTTALKLQPDYLDCYE